MHQCEVTLSIVSHNQASLIKDLLMDIDAIGAGYLFKEIIITNNVRENIDFNLEAAPLKIITNNIPKGFGENHNAAFAQCTSAFFCVVNPDIRLKGNPFPQLLERMKSEKLGVVGPKVINLQGELEDSARPFPRFLTIFKKLFGNKSAALYPANSLPESPDWIAGMFMLFNAQAFSAVGGFDERYFLYYEDADICARLRMAGKAVGYVSEAEVIHDARRDSHRKLRYLRWHLTSMLRFFLSPAYRSVRNK